MSMIQKACNDLGYQRNEGTEVLRLRVQFSACVTGSGVADMSGNLWEWAASPQFTSGSLRGGGWNLSAGLGQCRVQAKATLEYHAGEVGFRCWRHR